MARQPFVCSHCGLIIVGRVNPKTRLIYAYDRAATDDTPPQPMVCLPCLHKENAAIAAVGTHVGMDQ